MEVRFFNRHDVLNQHHGYSVEVILLSFLSIEVYRISILKGNRHDWYLHIRITFSEKMYYNHSNFQNKMSKPRIDPILSILRFFIFWYTSIINRLLDTSNRASLPKYVSSHAPCIKGKSIDELQFLFDVPAENLTHSCFQLWNKCMPFKQWDSFWWSALPLQTSGDFQYLKHPIGNQTVQRR